MLISFMRMIYLINQIKYFFLINIGSLWYKLYKTDIISYTNMFITKKFKMAANMICELL